MAYGSFSFVALWQVFNFVIFGSRGPVRVLQLSSTFSVLCPVLRSQSSSLFPSRQARGNAGQFSNLALVELEDRLGSEHCPPSSSLFPAVRPGEMLANFQICHFLD